MSDLWASMSPSIGPLVMSPAVWDSGEDSGAPPRRLATERRILAALIDGLTTIAVVTGFFVILFTLTYTTQAFPIICERIKKKFIRIDEEDPLDGERRRGIKRNDIYAVAKRVGKKPKRKPYDDHLSIPSTVNYDEAVTVYSASTSSLEVLVKRDRPELNREDTSSSGRESLMDSEAESYHGRRASIERINTTRVEEVHDKVDYRPSVIDLQTGLPMEFTSKMEDGEFPPEMISSTATYVARASVTDVLKAFMACDYGDEPVDSDIQVPLEHPSAPDPDASDKPSNFFSNLGVKKPISIFGSFRGNTADKDKSPTNSSRNGASPTAADHKSPTGLSVPGLSPASSGKKPERHGSRETAASKGDGGNLADAGPPTPPGGSFFAQTSNGLTTGIQNQIIKLTSGASQGFRQPTKETSTSQKVAGGAMKSSSNNASDVPIPFQLGDPAAKLPTRIDPENSSSGPRNLSIPPDVGIPPAADATPGPAHARDPTDTPLTVSKQPSCMTAQSELPGSGAAFSDRIFSDKPSGSGEFGDMPSASGDGQNYQPRLSEPAKPNELVSRGEKLAEGGQDDRVLSPSANQLLIPKYNRMSMPTSGTVRQRGVSIRHQDSDESTGLKPHARVTTAFEFSSPRKRLAKHHAVFKDEIPLGLKLNTKRSVHDFNAKVLYVSKVMPESQAERLGVRTGFMLSKANDLEPKDLFRKPELLKQMLSERPLSLTFDYFKRGDSS